MANEDLLQIVIVKTIKDIFKDKVLVFSNLQGVSIKGKNKWGYIKKLKDMGNMAGVSDLTILLPNGKSLWFEIKTLNGYQNEAQKEFEKKLRMLGHKYYVVRSSNEAIDIIDRELNEPNG